MEKVRFEAASEDPLKVIEINKMYINDFLYWLTFMIKKGDMEEREDAFQQHLRDAKRKR